ncbi:MAG: nickel pincer cofactor biosynthesis protein LarB [Syntrophomonadaceae bacterium]
MNKDRLKKILEQVHDGYLDVDDACHIFETLPFEDLGFARLDTHRAVRDHFPEVVFCEGKSVEHIVAIFERLYLHNDLVIGTRAGPQVYAAVREQIPEIQYNETARVLYATRAPVVPSGMVTVISAGTADLPVAEEAAACLEIMGVRVGRIYDVGVAGIHRLLNQVREINQSQVVIVAAGMEGALASVVGGLTKRPVIAVPTSVGYGASFNGLAALLTMLNSCAGGVGVVNIDNGYGAAALAVAILRTING